MGNSRKKLMSCLLSAALIASTQTFMAWAEENSIQNIYADTYGLDITYSSAPQADEYEGITLSTLSGENVSFQTMLEDNILHLNFDMPIETDTRYILSTAAGKKSIIVNKELFEDFEGLPVSTISNEDIKGNGWTSARGQGTFIAENEEFGGNKSKKLGITDGVFHITDSAILSNMDVTISLEMMQFKRNHVKSDGTQQPDNCAPHIGLRAAQRNYVDSYGLDVSATAASVGIHDYSGQNSYAMLGNKKDYTPDNGIKVGEIYCESADVEAQTAAGKVADNSDFQNLNYIIKEPSEEHSYVLRNYDNVIGGYFDGNYIGTVIDSENLWMEKQQMICQSTVASVMMIDNVLITSCTVEDIIEKNMPVESVYADTFHFELNMPEKVTGYEVSNLDNVILKEYKTGIEIEINAEDVSIYENSFRFDVALKTDTQYVLTVHEGFGTEATTVTGEFTKIFNIEKIWEQNFDTVPDVIVSNLIRSNQKDDASSNIRIQDGKLWSTNAVIAPIVPELANREDATFSFDMNLYSSLNTNEFKSNYSRTVPYMHMGFNAQALTIGGTNDVRFTWDNYGTRRYFWYINNSNQQRGHNAGYYTVIDPAEGSEYQQGDQYYFKFENNSGMVVPNAETTVIEGVGTVAYGEHYKISKHEAFVYGDAYFDSATKTYTVYHQGEQLPEEYTSTTTSGVTVSQRESQTIPTRIEKQGNIGNLVFNGNIADRYYTQDPVKTGYFAINNQQTEIAAYDNMLITAYSEIQTTNEVTLVNADCYGIVLDSPVIFGGINDFEGLSIVNVNTGEEVVPTGASYTGNYLYIDAQLEKETPYKVVVNSGFSGYEAMFMGSYTEYFIVKEILNVDGSDAEQLKTINISEARGENAYCSINGDHIELYNKSFNTGKYKNASVSYKLAYFGDSEEAGMYANNIIKGNDTTFTAMVSGKEDPQTIQKGAVVIYMVAANNDSANITIGTVDEEVVKYNNNEKFYVALDKGVYVMGRDENNYLTMDYSKTVEPHVERYVMTNDTYRIYKDNTLAYDFVQSGLNEEGYVQIGGSGRSVVWLYNAQVTQMEIIDTIDLSVADVDADANKIYVTFNNPVEGIKDFSKINVTADGQNVQITCSASENLLTIEPQGGIISDALYSVTVNEGFGPSEISYTTGDFNKKFTVTIYANETFDEGKISDGSKVRIDANNLGYQNGGVIFRDGSIGIDDAQMASEDDYTVKFDYKVYTASMNNADKNYNSTVPYSLMWFNAPAYTTNLPENGYHWYIQNAGVYTRFNENGMATQLGMDSFEEGRTEFGDAYLEDDKTITIFDEGYNFIDNGYIFSDEDGEFILQSERTAKLYEYKLDKQGKGASLYRDNVLISSFTGDESANINYTNGYFGLRAQITEFIWVDNMQAYTFKEATGVNASFDASNNRVIIENLDSDAKDVVIVIAAYDADNMMLTSYQSDIKTIQNGVTNVDYVLSGADNAVMYKAFVWDNLSDLKPYCKPAQYTIE